MLPSRQVAMHFIALQYLRLHTVPIKGQVPVFYDAGYSSPLFVSMYRHNQACEGHFIADCKMQSSVAQIASKLPLTVKVMSEHTLYGQHTNNSFQCP